MSTFSTRSAFRIALGIAFMLGILGLSGVARGTAEPRREPQGLRAEWTFAEGSGTTAADSSGNNVTGTLINGAAWSMGKIGCGLKFDGVNDYVALPANMSVAQNAPAVTVAGWVNLASIPASGVFRELVSLSINAASPTDTSRIALSLVGDGTGADLFAGARSTDAEAQKNVTATTADLGVGTWYHIAAVFDFAGNTIKVYRNGILLVTQAVTFASPVSANTPSTNGALGAQDTGSSNFFHGSLDEVRIYSRALTVSDVERLATGDGLRAQWKLDEGSGTIAADSSGNEFQGTLTGGPAWTTGHTGKALSFDGIDDRISLGANLSVVRNVNAATLSAWIQPASTIASGSFRELISISVNSGSPTNTSRVALALQGNGSGGNIFAGGRSIDTETQRNLVDNSSLAVGEWVHVAAVIDFCAKSITIYRNGVQTATAPAAFLQNHTPNTVSTNGALGAQDTGDSNYFDGLMDDVRIYGKALSAHDIHDLVMKDCLMGYWKFDEGTGTAAADSSGNGLTATLSNGAGWGAGQFGSAASLDGVNDFIALPANLPLLNQASAATVSAWINLSSLPASGAFRELVSLSVNAAAPTNTSRLALSLVGDGTGADVFAGLRSTDTEAQQNLTANANIGINTYTHVAAVFDVAGDSIKIYVNGALIASALVNFSAASTPATNSTNGALGSQDTGDSNYFSGRLDEVRVYCRALTSGEIQALATVSLPPTPTGLAGVAGNTKATLTWNSSAGASTYNLYRRLQGQSTFGPAIANVNALTYVDLGLTNGVGYEYAVSAVNAAGESARSSPAVLVTPAAPGQAPAKPTLVTVTGSTNDTTPDVVGKADPGVTVTVTFSQGATTIETLTTTSDFLGNWSVTAAAKADGAYTVKARASNSFGNSPDSDPITLTIDTGAPTILNVSSTTVDGVYTVGTPINVTVTFSEAVKLTGGNLLLTLNTGGVATIAPFGPATTASGTYTVSSGQNSTDLTATSPLTLSAGATLTDVAGNAAGLAIPNGQNLGDSKTIVIDTLAAAVSSVTSSTPNGIYGVGASINVTVNFTESVTLSGGNLQIALDTGAVVTVTPFGPAASASGTYTVGAGQSSADLNVTSPLTLQAGATLRDPAGNGVVLSIPAGQNLANLKNIVIDTTGTPAVASVTSTTLDGFYPAGSSINITVNFSKPVTLAGGNLQVTLNSGAVVSIVPFGPANSASVTYGVSAGQNAADLTVTSLTLATGATLRDSQNNNTVLTIPSTQNLGDSRNIVVDTIQPTIVSVSSLTPNGTYGVGASINITVTFSEAVSLAGGNLQVQLSTNTTVSIAPFALANTASGTYTVTAGQTSTHLSASSPLTLTGGTLRDAAGNNSTLTVPGGSNLGDLKSIVIDTSTTGTAAPVITTQDKKTNKTTPVIAGTSVSNAVIRVFFNGVQDGSFTASGTSWSYTALTKLDGVYIVTATATVGGSTSSPSNAVVITVDTIPPAPPTSLVATPKNGAIALSWVPSVSPDTRGYNIYRKTTGSFSKINTKLVLGSNYLDSAVSATVTYTYQVTAVDDTLNEVGP